jgi:LPXTG-motif cell wall-anchored protein
MLRKTLLRLLCCIAILCLTAASVFAAGSTPDALGEVPEGEWITPPADLDRLGAVIFDFSAAKGVEFRGTVELWQVARWDSGSGALQWTEDFAGVADRLGNWDRKDYPKWLKIYAESKEIAPLRVEVDSSGRGRAENLPLGVYLVGQTTAFPGCEPISPCLLWVPCPENFSWIYEVDAMPKVELKPIPMIPEEDVPTPHKPHELPQTGQVNWPVPVLAAVGTVCILLGLFLRREKRHEA